MLLQTNSYIVPKDKRSAHLNLMRRFRQVLAKIGCDHFEVFEQVGANWTGGDTSGRFVQLMKFRDRKHCQAVQLAEKSDPAAQSLVRDFCELINFQYQEQQGLFAHGYYQAVIEPIKVRQPSGLAFHADADGKPIGESHESQETDSLALDLDDPAGADASDDLSADPVDDVIDTGSESKQPERSSALRR